MWLNNKKLWVAVLVPLMVTVAELPKMFAKKMVEFGAGELVQIYPGLKAIQNDKVYTESGDTLYTFDTDFDSMTGNSLKLRQLYYRFSPGNFVVHGWDVIKAETYPLLESDAGEEMINGRFDEFTKYLKKSKNLFWNSVKKECKLKGYKYSEVKKEFKNVLKYEKELLNDMLKMDEMRLIILYNIFQSSCAERLYFNRYCTNGGVGLEQLPEDGNREKVNNFLLAISKDLGWKTRLFVNQSDGTLVMDYGWYLNIAMMVKYRNGTCTETLSRFKKVLEIIE